jgi:osmoprotectant transport system permease protein
VKEELALLPGYLTAHLELSLFALLVGTTASVPLALFVSRRPRLERAVLGVASAIQTVPALALLALMVPLLAFARLPSIGYLPAAIALVLYSALPILRNTVAGLRAIDPALLEAAAGVGMTSREQRWHVEVPLALPVIIAGVRTAAVWTVGMATLSTPIGAPSLGNFIFSGLQTRNFHAVLVGCIASAVLALTLDAILRNVLAGVEARNRRRTAASLAVLVALYLFAGGAFARSLVASRAPKVIVGAKTFTEQYVLAEIIAQQVERDTGRRAEIRASLGSSVAFDALCSSEIDTYVDYTGTLWATVLKRSDVPPSREAAIADVGREIEQRFGVVLLGPLGFENAYALAMRRADAERRRIEKLSDLRGASADLVIGGDYEFFDRAEWRAIKSRYGLAFREQRAMDPSLMYEAIAHGEVDVISAYSSDGRIAAFDLVVLADDAHAIPPYDAVLLMSPRAASEQPATRAALEALIGRITPGEMRAMNREVDEKHVSAKAVASEFLKGSSAPAPRGAGH